MEEAFYIKLQELLCTKDLESGRTFIMDRARYDEIINQVKEAKEKKKCGGTLSSKDYRRINRFDVIQVGSVQMLIEKSVGELTDIKYFCRYEDIFGAIHAAHLNTGHKKGKAMEAELKKKFCNITREVIKIYLDMCEACALKKRSIKKGLVVKLMVMSAMNSRCQVDLIDMQSEADGEYRFILNYQDHLTKFVILRPLKIKTADEVADVLLDIFCIFGAPNILHSDNGREFCNKIIETLATKWSAIKLVQGKPRHSQSQGSVERANQDVRDSLVAWMADNDTSNWANGLRIVQNTKNNSYHSGIKMTPYEAMFGAPQKNGLRSSILTEEVCNRIGSEEELEQELMFVKNSINENDMTQDNDELVDNAMLDQNKAEFNQRNILVCSVCDQTIGDDECALATEKCFECGQKFHLGCFPTTEFGCELPLCSLCSKKSAVETARGKCKLGLGSQAEKMLKISGKKLPSVSVGDNVVVQIPEVDRGRLAPRNIIAVVMNVDEDHHTLGTKHGTLDKQFSRNQFQPIKNKFLKTDEVPEPFINVRQEAMVSSGSKQGFVKCGCKQRCTGKSCKCLKSNVKCNSKCHSSTTCANK